MSNKTRFEKEAKRNSEMVYYYAQFWGLNKTDYGICKKSALPVVSFAAVIRVVT